MLQTLDQMALASAAPVTPRTWAAIPEYLKEKVAGGGSKSSAAKTKSAASGLLKTKCVTAENAPLNLEWFDRMFPADGWDPATMLCKKATYEDRRHRVRPLIEEMLGVADEKKAVRAAVDEWNEAATEFERLEQIKGPHSKQKIVPIRNTLTMAARRARIREGHTGKTPG